MWEGRRRQNRTANDEANYASASASLQKKFITDNSVDNSMVPQTVKAKTQQECVLHILSFNFNRMAYWRMLSEQRL